MWDLSGCVHGWSGAAETRGHLSVRIQTLSDIQSSFEKPTVITPNSFQLLAPFPQPQKVDRGQVLSSESQHDDAETPEALSASRRDQDTGTETTQGRRHTQGMQVDQRGKKKKAKDLQGFGVKILQGFRLHKK